LDLLFRCIPLPISFLFVVKAAMVDWKSGSRLFLFRSFFFFLRSSDQVNSLSPFFFFFSSRYTNGVIQVIFSRLFFPSFSPGWRPPERRSNKTYFERVSLAWTFFPFPPPSMHFMTRKGSSWLQSLLFFFLPPQIGADIRREGIKCPVVSHVGNPFFFTAKNSEGASALRPFLPPSSRHQQDGKDS